MSPTCVVERENAENETIYVYNKAFVDKNFREVDDIHGVFTLGKDAGDAQAFIEEKEAERDRILEDVRQKNETLEKFSTDIRVMEDEFYNSCWEKKLKYDSDFSQAMEGTRNSKAAFARKCLEVFKSVTDWNVMGEGELKELYHVAYSKNALVYESFKLLNAERMVELDHHRLLEKRITGKADSDIGRFIDYLGSSDWVKGGMHFADKAKNKCPYCGQNLPVNLKQDIENYFDETFELECAELKSFAEQYSAFGKTVIQAAQRIIDSKYEIIDYSALRQLLELFNTTWSKNCLLLKNKLESPSMIIELEHCADLIVRMNDQINKYNDRITENNKLVQNQRKAKQKCTNEVWRYIVSHLKDTIETYVTQRQGKEKGFSNIQRIRNEKKEQADRIDDEIREKRASISDIHYTIESINKILEGYGFTGFKLAENNLNPGTYKIIRHDGSDAKSTLSEGEYNFITFLYFYHSIFGTKSPDEVNRSKVVVIDDPISSLDSNVLFIVSSLVKKIISDCRENTSSIVQVIISTHNIYFHKEVTFVSLGDHLPELMTAFYVIRKKNEVSYITEYEKNPIQSSYEMLWDDIRNPGNGTAKSIFNTMRRILENYFNLIGHLNYESCINAFEGEDKMICKSLVSCINEQSHIISDDFYICIEDSELDRYLLVFKKIFEEMGHISHYNMMMKIS